MKTALVLGAGGFIGSHMVKQLKSEGYWVRGVDLKYPDFSETHADDFIVGDLRDAKLVDDAVSNQGKPFNEDNRHHMIIELGDIMWYVAQACMALGVSIDEVIAGNVTKLEKRYPGGSFDPYYSENRAEDDL